MIGAVEGDGERGAGAAGGAFETRVGGDHVVSQNSAVAPAADSQAIRIGDAHGDHVLDAGLQIFDFVMTPVRKDRTRIFLPASGAAAIVHCQHCITVRGEHLALDAE